MITDRDIARLSRHSLDFLQHHHVDNGNELSGGFSLYRGQATPDLYGMIDAVYIYYTLGRLQKETDKHLRMLWADKILACQDNDGWFTKLNLRGHRREHATSYAIGALCLLEIEESENYLDALKPLKGILPLLTDEANFLVWMDNLDFRFTWKNIREKYLGWHYVWSGSHVGAGIPASIGMVGDLLNDWWPGKINTRQWFAHYFDWLDTHVNPETGYWQRAFWNVVIRKPTLIDMGGAVHFYWLYQALNRPFLFPEKVIQSTLELQRANGLYKDYPYCIDLDGNYCLIRPYLQLSEDRREEYKHTVYLAVERNFEAIINALLERPLMKNYSDSHGLPGALAALVECTKLPGFKYAELLSGWRHPLDRAWWL